MLTYPAHLAHPVLSSLWSYVTVKLLIMIMPIIFS
jgi:hypothetical protein